MVYFSLNFVEKYEQRTILAALVMVYAVLMCVSALSSINSFHRVERLERETGRLIQAIDAAASIARFAIINNVTDFRKASEIRSYIDLLVHILIVLLCISKIVAS
jgi:uncharacterized membrane protein affecting hemolysin expression